MNVQELLNDFRTMSNTEVYYKRVFDHRGHKYFSREYIDSFDFMDIVNTKTEFLADAPEHALVLPEEITNAHHFYGENREQGVLLFRHQRYTPVFNHKHTFFEIVVVIEGSCINIMNNEEFIMNEGDICIIPPGAFHGVWVAKGSVVMNMHVQKQFFKDIWSSFSFSQNTLSTFFSNSMFTTNENRFLSLHTGNDRDIINLILEMYIEHHYETKYKIQVIESLTVVLFSKLLRRYEDIIVQNNSSKFENSITAQFVEYIEQNIANINLETMAKHFNYSPQYISKKIKNASGYTFSAIVKQLRYEQAKKLLKTTSDSVGQIARVLGYQNAENFTRTFKSICGINPNDYRKNNKTNEKKF